MIYTIGHSTHTADAFLDLLAAHGIQQLADVRTIPASRRHPHFSKEPLRALLAEHGIMYRHFPGLGGLRKPRRDTENTGLRHEAFRGYADHMQTSEFLEAVHQLEKFATVARTTVMCAEAVWWRCHRQLLADALLVRGVPVWHILSRSAPKVHELSEFARADHGRVIYPGLL
ncbi:MAG TPA: DUF488 domain-containing protein [Gemmatimonadaceae bacterium]|nr:DUF488 domain-containing protein [Gemmatimonadaceae bacterium]